MGRLTHLDIKYSSKSRGVPPLRASTPSSDSTLPPQLWSRARYEAWVIMGHGARAFVRWKVLGPLLRFCERHCGEGVPVWLHVFVAGLYWSAEDAEIDIDACWLVEEAWRREQLRITGEELCILC